VYCRRTINKNGEGSDGGHADAAAGWERSGGSGVQGSSLSLKSETGERSVRIALSHGPYENCQKQPSQTPSWREVAYSLAPPGLTSETVSGHEREREALAQLGFDEDGRALIALIGVLLVDGGVVLLGVIATLEDNVQELSKLGQGVT
jgi:hypothetical protein